MSNNREGPDESTRHGYWETLRGEARGEQCCCPGGLCCGGVASGTPTGTSCPGSVEVSPSSCTTDADCEVYLDTCVLVVCMFCEGGYEYRYVTSVDCFEAATCFVDGAYGCCA